MSGRVLVTGGAGFIGTHVVRALLDRGEDVVILDSFEEQVHGGKFVYPEDATLYVGDAGDESEALFGVDRVIHLAAAVGVGQSQYDYLRYIYKNTVSTGRLLQRLIRHRPKRLVVASSMSIYGEGQYFCSRHGHQYFFPRLREKEQLEKRRWEHMCPMCKCNLESMPTPETKALNPASAYAITKRDQEELCLVLGEAHGIPTVALRFFNTYGEGQALSNPYTGAAAIFATQLLNGKSPTVYEDGLQTRDFIHVSDIVRGVLLALDSDVHGEAINLGTGLRTTIESLARDLKWFIAMTSSERGESNSFRSGDIRHCFADTDKARRLLGFKAEVSLADGLEELVAWLRTQPLPADRSAAANKELADRGLLV